MPDVVLIALALFLIVLNTASHTNRLSVELRSTKCSIPMEATGYFSAGRVGMCSHRLPQALMARR